MNSSTITSPFVNGEIPILQDKRIEISVVAYETPAGLPARFCMGFVPAIDIARRIKAIGRDATIRIIDPTPIADYCNGWSGRESVFQDEASSFLRDANVPFFIDRAEDITRESLEFLGKVAEELEYATDSEIADLILRIKVSAHAQGGEKGLQNALIYMAAHPFSWLDLYHPLLWSRRNSVSDTQYLNVMSKPESRYTGVRKFLRSRLPDLRSGVTPLDLYMTVCNVPCYLSLPGEPSLNDLRMHGYRAVEEQYARGKKESENHRRIFKDFVSLMNFVSETV